MRPPDPATIARQRAAACRARGFLLKDVPSEYLVMAVRCAARGDALIDPAVTRRLIQRFVHAARPSGDLPPPLTALTARERDVLRQVVRGLSNAEIAEQRLKPAGNPAGGAG